LIFVFLFFFSLDFFEKRFFLKMSKTWAQIALNCPVDKLPSEWYREETNKTAAPVVNTRTVCETSETSEMCAQRLVALKPTVQYKHKVDWINMQLLRGSIRCSSELVATLGLDDNEENDVRDPYSMMYRANSANWCPSFRTIERILVEFGDVRVSERQLVDALDAHLGFQPSSNEQVSDYYYSEREKRKKERDRCRK
jgi:hypothetical protein